MARPIVTIPRPLLRLLSFEWSFDRRGTGLGNNLAGVSVASYSQFPVWRGSLSLSYHGSQIGQWRALHSQVQGRHGIYAIEMIDPAVFGEAEARTAVGIGTNGFPYSDGAYFSDGSGFAFIPVCHTVGAHSVGAKQLLLDVAQSSVPPKIGQVMSAGDYPFVVERVSSVGGSQYRVQIGSPCLRVDLEHGAEVRHVARGLFEAIDDTSGTASYGPARHARPVLELREALRR